VAIDLDADENSELVMGNRIDATGKFEFEDGSSGTYAQVTFAVSRSDVISQEISDTSGTAENNADKSPGDNDETVSIPEDVENLVLAESSAPNAVGNSLGNKITGNSVTNDLSGLDGDDTLLGGTGADILSGGSGADVFGYSSPTDGGAVSSNQTTSAAGVSGDTIEDFVSGTDKLNFVSSAFGGLSTGALTNGTNFSIITEAYKGDNAGTNSEFTADDPTFIFDSTDTLYYDANGSSAGYTVIATTLGTNIVAADLEIVSSL
jgi:Ca2+-binding RTX toxin-like protein